MALNPFDMTFAMLVKCGGKANFFGAHNYLMANQKDYLSKIETITPASIAKLEANDWPGFMQGMYDDLELNKIVPQLGITDAKAKSCLANAAAFKQLAAVTQEATAAYAVQGTPSFLVNNTLVSDVHDFDGLIPYLQATP
jgi:hypothetical protein